MSTIIMSEECSCYDILQSDKYGRYAVASKNFEPGDLIISELPFAWGPKSDSPPICLGCHARIDQKTMCSTCGWPVCNEACEKLPIHAENECKIFSGVKIRFVPVKNLESNCPQYECITPLRILLAKEKYPEKWESEVKVLESHAKERRNTEMWEVETINVVNFLQKVCKLKNRFSEDLIHFVCGVLETNAFATPDAFGYEIRCLYPKASLLLHSCAPNVGHYIFKNLESNMGNRLYVRAMVKIAKGEELLLTYSQTLWPTLFRRAFLKEGKFFDCSCRRCSDPTELGTHMSTLKCTQCDNGMVLSSNPLDEKAAWNCNVCKFKVDVNSVTKLLRNIQNEIEEFEYRESDDPIASREILIKKFRSVLHPNHALLLNLKSSLSQLYGIAYGYHLEDLPDILLERKIQLCELIGTVSNAIKPGLSRQRGWNLYELHAPIVKQAKNQFLRKEITENELKSKLEKAVKLLKEVVLIFSYDDPCSPEGIAGKMASYALENLKSSVQDLTKISLLNQI